MSQMIPDEPKRGFKGLLQKMRPKEATRTVEPNRFKSLPPLPSDRPRASYDPGRQREAIPTREVQSMYIEDSFDAWPRQKGKKGLKGFFGGAKAGRVA